MLQRAPCYGDTNPMLLPLQESEVEAARLWYGKGTLEMECNAVGGGHFAETVSCAMGENDAFVQVLPHMLQP